MASDEEGRWERYFVRDGGHLLSVVVDLDLHARAPMADLPLVTRFVFPVETDDTYRFFTPDEGDVLDRAVAAVETLVSRASGGLRRLLGGANAVRFVGRRSRAGESQLFFYCRRPLGKALLTELEDYLPGRDWSCGEREDPGWSTYLDTLHPGPALTALLATRAQLDSRRRQGDDLGVERVVDHVLLFRDEAGRQAFLDDAGTGHEAELQTYETEGDHRWAVELAISHALVPTEVEPYVVALAQRAARFSGVYDGWGALVVGGQSASH